MLPIFFLLSYFSFPRAVYSFLKKNSPLWFLCHGCNSLSKDIFRILIFFPASFLSFFLLFKEFNVGTVYTEGPGVGRVKEEKMLGEAAAGSS